MKNKTLTHSLFAFLLLLFFSGQTFSQGIVFYKGPFEGALEKASREGKKVMVDCVTDWCGWCKVMDRETFSVDSVGDFFNEHFICIKIDMEKEGIDLAKKFRVLSYPQYIFFDSKGTPLMKSQGYQKPGYFLEEGRKALDPAHYMQYKGNPKKLDPGFPDFYHDAFKAGKERKMPSDSVVYAFLDTQKAPMEEVAWNVMWRFNLNEKWQQFVLKNAEALISRYGKTDVLFVMDKIVYSYLDQAIDAEDISLLQPARDLLDKYYEEKDANDRKPFLNYNYYVELEDWPNMALTVNEIFKESGSYLHPTLNEAAWTLYERSDDKKLLSMAEKWMKQVVEDFPDDYAYMDTYAAVLYKTGDLKNARKWAEKAIELGKSKGMKVGGTEELLKMINDGN